MKLIELIQRVQSLYSKGVQSDDTRLSNRHIYNKIVSVRSMLISQQIKKRQMVSDWNYQVISCMELEEVPAHMCPCIPPIGCSMYRSKYKLPNILTDYNRHLIQSVTSITGDYIFSETSWVAKKYKRGNKYTAFKPDFFIRDGYLYITDKTPIDIVAFTAIFEDPFEASQYQMLCAQSNECVDILEKDFPIDRDMVDTLIQLCVEELIALFQQMPEDQTNNSKDTQIEGSK